MGRLVIKYGKDKWEVRYFTGRGKMRQQVHHEVIDATDKTAAAEIIGTRVDEIRAQVKPVRFVPGMNVQ